MFSVHTVCVSYLISDASFHFPIHIRLDYRLDVSNIFPPVLLDPVYDGCSSTLSWE